MHFLPRTFSVLIHRKIGLEIIVGFIIKTRSFTRHFFPSNVSTFKSIFFKIGKKQFRLQFVYKNFFLYFLSQYERQTSNFRCIILEIIHIHEMLIWSNPIQIFQKRKQIPCDGCYVMTTID